MEHQLSKPYRWGRDAGTILMVWGIVCATVPVPAQPLVTVGSPAAFHPGRIITQPRQADELSRLNELHAAGNRRVLCEFPGLGGMQVVEIARGESVADAVMQYRQSGRVQFAEPDYRVSAAATLSNDPRFQDGTQWALNNFGQNSGLADADVDAPEAWDVRHSASNVIVAIVDSGVRYTHEDLAENLWVNPLDGSHGIRVMTNASTGTWLVDTNVWDDFGHGTHVAGIIGALGNNGKGVAGVAWRVQLMVCKFLDAQGEGFYSDAVTCIEFARSNGATVINLSWGGGAFSAGLSNAIFAARNQGILFAAAAGNQARNNDVFRYYPASIDLDNIVAVGASTRQDGRWSSSNYGMTNVDLFAPGATIYSTRYASDTAYENRDGTSMATAFVAGAVALLRAESPTAPYPELVARLLTTADVRPAFAGRCTTGARLNLLKLLDRPALAVADDCGGCLPTLPIRLRLTGVPGHSYVLQASTNASVWAPIQTNSAGPDGAWSFLDPQSTSLPYRLYRGVAAP